MDKAKGAVWRGAVAASKQMPPITLPPMPPLPRAAGAAGAGWSGLLNQFSGTASTSAFSTGNGQPGASPAGAAAYGSKRGQAEAVELARRSTAAATTSVKAMCVRINSLVFAHAQLATLRGFVLGAWERLRIADAHDPRTGERYAHTLLRASDATLKLAAREVSAHMGIRVCFVDTRGPLLDELHAQPPRGAGVRAHVLRSLLEQLLSPALETVLALVEEGPTRTHALLGICCAAASAYERVLLDGGARLRGCLLRRAVFSCAAPPSLHRLRLAGVSRRAAACGVPRAAILSRRLIRFPIPYLRFPPPLFRLHALLPPYQASIASSRHRMPPSYARTPRRSAPSSSREIATASRRHVQAHAPCPRF